MYPATVVSVLCCGESWYEFAATFCVFKLSSATFLQTVFIYYKTTQREDLLLTTQQRGDNDGVLRLLISELL